MGNERTPGAPTTKRYTPEEKARAVRLVRQLRKELVTSHGTIQRVADADPGAQTFSTGMGMAHRGRS